MNTVLALAFALSSITPDPSDVPAATAPVVESDDHISATAIGATAGAIAGQATAIGGASVIAISSLCIFSCTSAQDALRMAIVPAYLVPAFVVPVGGTLLGHMIEYGSIDATSLLAGTASATTMTIGTAVSGFLAMTVATTFASNDPAVPAAGVFVAGAIGSAVMSGFVAGAIDGGSHE